MSRIKYALFLLLFFLPGHVFCGQTLIYSGGVAGVETLMDSTSSASFRFHGGGIYLHGTSWNWLDTHQKKRVIDAAQGAPFAVEIGFGKKAAHAKAWAEKLKKEYLDLDINPDFLVSNIDRQLTVAEWKQFLAQVRKVQFTGPIYPVYTPNSAEEFKAIEQKTISKNGTLQEIVKLSGGLALDAPSKFFLDERPKAYKIWVIDAIQWCHKHTLTVVSILSPHTSGQMFEEDTKRFLNYLKSKEALPDIYVVENYQAKPRPGYVPVVGREWIPDTALGVAWYLLNDYFPRLARQPK